MTEFFFGEVEERGSPLAWIQVKILGVSGVPSDNQIAEFEELLEEEFPFNAAEGQIVSDAYHAGEKAFDMHSPDEVWNVDVYYGYQPVETGERLNDFSESIQLANEFVEEVYEGARFLRLYHYCHRPGELPG